MGRIPFLTTIAWGRSIWTSPAENEWNVATQSSAPTPIAVPEPPAAHYSAAQQQYDANLRPINPVAQRAARERRVAANNILSLIGIVEQTRRHDGDDRGRKRKQSASDFPVLIATKAVLAVASGWIVNFSTRLLAAQYAPGHSLTELFYQDYRILGAKQFFLGGLPALSTKIFAHPNWLAPMSTYWTIRAVLAAVESLETRNTLLGYRTHFYNFIYIVAELLNFPLRLNSMLQQMGLIQTYNFVPNKLLLLSIYDSIQPMHKIAAPLMVAFLYGPLTFLVTKNLIQPRVVAVLDSIDDLLEDDYSSVSIAQPPMNDGLEETSITTEPQAEQPATLAQQNFSLHSPGLGGHPIQQGYLTFDEDTNVELESSTPDAVPSFSGTADTMAVLSRPALQPRPSSNDERMHQIRIGGRESENNSVIETLNISFFNRDDAGVVTARRSRKERSAARRREQRKADGVVSAPRRTLEGLISAHVMTLCFLPLDSWLLPRIASWWIARNGAIGPLAIRPPMASSAIESASTHHFSLTSTVGKASQIMICLAIREIIAAGVLAAQTQAVVWLNHRTKERDDVESTSQ